VLVTGKPIQPSLMFAGEAEAYPSEALSAASFKSRLQALPTNIRLDMKGLPWTNSVAYYEHS
jgi:hypothetical protein